MMLLAQAMNVPPTTTGNWMLGFAGFSVGLGGVLWCCNQALKLFDRAKGRSTIPQPMNVEIVKALHDQFADKEAFDALMTNNTMRHGQLFASIARVEREAREAMEKRFAVLNEERRLSLEKLNDQFVFIREHIAAINKELQLKGK